MGELTDSGYVIKTQNEWFEEEQQLYLSIDANWNLDPSSPDGLKIASDSENFGNLDEVAQRAYNSKDPAKATGYDLRVLSAITGTIPSDGSPSDVTLTLGGTDGSIIPIGSVAENTVNGSRWVTTSAGTISGGTATVSAQSEDQGAIEASAGDINKPITPISGWLTVTNAAPATLGANPDSDAELRKKREQQVALPGNNQVDSLFAAVANVDDVRAVVVYENEEGVNVILDSLTLPPHSTTTIVDGGLDQDIGEAMYTKKNPGTKQHQGTNPVDVNVTSPVTGNIKVMKFSRPVDVAMIIVVDVTDDGTLPSSPQIEDEIKQAIIDYAGGDLDAGSATGFNQTGFTIGEDVNASRLYTPVNNVIGSYGNSFVTLLTTNGGAAVAIDAQEIARFTTANITVNITP